MENNFVLQWKAAGEIPKAEKKRVRKALRSLPILLSVISNDDNFCIAVLSKLPFTQESQKIFTDGIDDITRKMHILANQQNQRIKEKLWT